MEDERLYTSSEIAEIVGVDARKLREYLRFNVKPAGGVWKKSYVQWVYPAEVIDMAKKFKKKLEKELREKGVV